MNSRKYGSISGTSQLQLTNQTKLLRSEAIQNKKVFDNVQKLETMPHMVIDSIGVYPAIEAYCY